MDDPKKSWYFPAMASIPVWHLYGEASPFPDLLHIERIVDRAAGMDWRIAPHRHAQLHQIFLIRHGSIALKVNGESIAPALPVALNIPPGTIHEFVFASGTDGHVLTLPTADFPELFGPDAALLSEPFHVPGGELIAAFDRVAERHSESAPLRALRLRAAATDLVCDLHRQGCALDPMIAGPRLARLESLVRGHLADGWLVADYAAALHLSERHMRRLCLETFGVSAHRFIEQVRLREACRLLAYTRMQVQQIGFALGFDDQAYFARVFRRGMRMTPSAYRIAVASASMSVACAS